MSTNRSLLGPHLIFPTQLYLDVVSLTMLHGPDSGYSVDPILSPSVRLVFCGMSCTVISRAGRPICQRGEGGYLTVPIFPRLITVPGKVVC